MTPAAILSIQVQTKGVGAASAQLKGLDASAKNAGDGLQKASDQSSKTGGAFSSLGKVAKMAGPLLGAAGLAAGAKAAINEFEEAQKVGANTARVIKTTGGAANVTAKQVADLAGALSKKTGIDDEAIQSGSNLLLTFKNIRNETGAGRDIFNQATKAAVDLSAAGFGSLSSTSKQLGKALNDPIKGMTALGRSGVTFSADQKKAIEALLATGKAADRVKAQQIILREVQSQVGGSAAAQATAMDKMKVAFGNLAEAAGSILVPALEVIMRGLTSLINQFVEGEGVARFIIPAFLAVGNAVAAVVGFFRQHTTTAIALAAAVGTLAAAYVAMQVISGISAMIHVFNGLLIAQRAGLLGVTLAQYGLNTAMLANPFVIAAVLLAALVAGLVIAYRESETFRNIVNAAFGAVKTVAAAVFGALTAIIVTPFRVARDILGGEVLPGIAGRLSETWGGIKTAATATWNAVKGFILAPIRAARDLLGGEVLPGIAARLSTGWETIKTGASTAWDKIKSFITTPIGEAASFVRNTLGSEGLGGWLESTWGNMRKGAAIGWELLKNTTARAFGGIANVVIGFVNEIINAINWVLDKIGADKIGKLKSVGVPDKMNAGEAAKAAGFARGGAFARTGGVVSSPMVMLGEEAPRWPEWVIPSNPAYRGRAQMLLGQAAGAIGFQAGGVYSQKQMEDLWVRAGGPESQKRIAGAVGMAESRGIASVVNSIGAGGLWQIHPPEANYLDPMTNARIAVRKFRERGWQPWEAFTNGNYKSFLDGGGGVLGAISGAVGAITGILGQGVDAVMGKFKGMLPDTKGLPDWLSPLGGFLTDKVSSWVRDQVSDVIGLAGGGGAVGGGVSGSIKGAMAMARAMGLTITSTTGGQHAKNSWHYKGRAADVAGPPGQMAAFFDAALAKYGRNLLELFYDPRGAIKNGSRIGAIGGHSDHVHIALARGGVFGAPFVGSYAGGGVVPRDGLGYLHAGETVTASGERGPLMVVEGDLVLHEEMDLERQLRKLAWAVETA